MSDIDITFSALKAFDFDLLHQWFQVITLPQTDWNMGGFFNLAKFQNKEFA